jgi:hypothetical protein
MSSGQYDQETLDKWLDEDLARIHDETLWKEQKKGKVGDHEAVCFVHKQKDDSFWWFKVVASMPDATLAQARCVPLRPPPSLDRFGLSKLIFTPFLPPPPQRLVRCLVLGEEEGVERPLQGTNLASTSLSSSLSLFRSFLIILIQIN